MLLPQSEAERLKHWKNPIKQGDSGAVAGDFVGVLMSVMRKRARQDGGKLTINGLN